jgi:hypothetical protein
MFAWAAIAQAPKPAALRAIGILEAPRLEKNSVDPVVLRRRPSADSPIVATISSLEALEIEEYAYERSLALVFGRERDWSLIKTSAGVAGLAADGQGAAAGFRFMPFPVSRRSGSRRGAASRPGSGFGQPRHK